MNLKILSVCYVFVLVNCDDGPPYFRVMTKQTKFQSYYKKLAGVYCKTKTKTDGRFFAYQLKTGKMYLQHNFGHWAFKPTLSSSDAAIESVLLKNNYPGNVIRRNVYVESVWENHD